jgi:citrate lyase subunit beta/citryl-CoA lyase
MPAYRSFLFAPGNHARKVLKVFDCGADNVILDLEDAVAKAEKVATRALVVEALKRPHQSDAKRGGAYVRVNGFHTEFCYGDALAVVGPGLDGIILPMVESREQIVAFDWLVGALERERGLPPGGVDIIPIIETAKGIANARAIAAAGTRVKRMAFGAGDYTLDVNMEWTLGESELEHARAEMVVAARAAGLE